MVTLINICIYKGMSSQQDIFFFFFFHFFDLQMKKYAQKRGLIIYQLTLANLVNKLVMGGVI